MKHNIDGLSKATAIMYSFQPRKLPTTPSAPESNVRDSAKISSRNKRREISQIPVRRTSESSKTKPAPLLRNRSREFMDAVKKFEGGKLPEKFLKTVDEEKKTKEERMLKCDNDLKELREFLGRTEDDFQGIRRRTEKIRKSISELHALNKRVTIQS